MQCSNCHFENMPGVVACGRCGASLKLAEAPIDVHPPRAGRLAKWWRWFPLAYLPRVLKRRLGEFVTQPIRPFVEERPANAVILRMIVPGWAQIYLGQHARGMILLGSYLGTLLLGTLFWGTALGSVLLGLTAATHAASVIDIVFIACEERHARVVYSVACCLLVAFVLYVPVCWLVTRVAVPIGIRATVPPFAAGDVVFYNPSAYRRVTPEVGDVVLYTLPIGDIAVPGRGHTVYRAGGERIDRIVAGPGETAVWKEGKLWVDGQLSPWLPLNPSAVPVDLTVKVPQDAYLILPSNSPEILRGWPAPVLRQLAIVPRASILGRTYLRTHPLSRWWWIR